MLLGSLHHRLGLAVLEDAVVDAALVLRRDTRPLVVDDGAEGAGLGTFFNFRPDVHSLFKVVDLLLHIVFLEIAFIDLLLQIFFELFEVVVEVPSGLLFEGLEFFDVIILEEGADGVADHVAGAEKFEYFAARLVEDVFVKVDAAVGVDDDVVVRFEGGKRVERDGL